jgi:hypothetical protein
MQPTLFRLPQMIRDAIRFAIFALLLVGTLPLQSYAAGTVELDLVSQRGFPFELTHQWIKVFKDLGIQNVRIRAGQPGDESTITVRGSEKEPVYAVTGILAANGTLHMGGKQFKVENPRQIGDWIKELTEHGPGGAKKEKPAPFGLSLEQFSEVRKDLARKVGFSTKDKPLGEVVARIAAPLSHRLTIDGSATKALAGGEVVLDELSDVSSGTALAAALRPAGVILLPRKQGGGIELIATSSTGAKELWPIGWTSETAPGKLLPKLVEATNVEIEETPLAETLTIVAKRLETPVLFDHNNIARKDIDIAKVNASLPAERLTYSNVLRKLLYQGQLKYELRVDEADKPLLWISPLR